MKHILIALLITVSSNTFSQVIIGDGQGTVPAGEKQSVLLEFARNQNKGIILPYVTTLPSGAGLVGGTLLVDATDPTKATVKFYHGPTTENPSGWFDLSSGNQADITPVMTQQPNLDEMSDAKVIIGARTSTAAGVLVLESDTKALVLPMVENTSDIPDPAPGMMVFINKAGAKRLAVYNGGGWTFWKP